MATTAAQESKAFWKKKWVIAIIVSLIFGSPIAIYFLTTSNSSTAPASGSPPSPFPPFPPPRTPPGTPPAPPQKSYKDVQEFINELLQALKDTTGTTSVDTFLQSTHDYLQALSIDDNWKVLNQLASSFPTIMVVHLKQLIGAALVKAPITDTILSLPPEWSPAFAGPYLVEYLKQTLEKHDANYDKRLAILRAVWIHLSSQDQDWFSTRGIFPFSELDALKGDNATEQDVATFCTFLQQCKEEAKVAIVKLAFTRIKKENLETWKEKLWDGVKEIPNAQVYLLAQMKKGAVAFDKLISDVALITTDEAADLYLATVDSQIHKEDIIATSFHSKLGQRLACLILQKPDQYPTLLDKIPLEKIVVEAGHKLADSPLPTQLIAFLTTLPWQPAQQEMFKRFLSVAKDPLIIGDLVTKLAKSPQQLKMLLQTGSEYFPFIMANAPVKQLLFVDLARNDAAWKELKSVDATFINDFVGSLSVISPPVFLEFANPYLDDSHIDNCKNREKMLRIVILQDIEHATLLVNPNYTKFKAEITQLTTSINILEKGLLGLTYSGEGNSCFFNAFTQSLLHTKEFGSVFEQVETRIENNKVQLNWDDNMKDEKKAAQYQVVQTFLQLYRTYWRAKTGESVTKKDFYAAMKNYFTKFQLTDILNNQQQDVTECLVPLLDCFRTFVDEQLDPHSSTFSDLPQLFRDTFEIKCQSEINYTCACNNGNPVIKSLAQEDTMMFVANFPDGHDASGIDFDKIWANSMQAITEYTCGDCRQKIKGIKTTKIANAPQIRIISFSRFQFSSDYKTKSKIHTPINFPSSMELVFDGQKYEIYCCINHIGGVDSGHYIAHWKQPQKGTWHVFDDGSHSEITDAQAMQQLQACYVVFLRRK